MRGKPHTLGMCAGSQRITPARAGKTTAAPSRHTALPDHPRACGENASVLCVPLLAIGSPPRVRGKHSIVSPPEHRRRITPARAGKTCAGDPAAGRHEDHPRACGENLPLRMPSRPLGGSPPRVRGKPDALCARGQRRRITPARAGKTLRRRGVRGMGEDHPRACGENASPARPVFRPGGSPPRVRGKRTARSDCGGTPGITPARAGKTLTAIPSPPHLRDHPRACGENKNAARKNPGGSGSPPRVRGKRM